MPRYRFRWESIPPEVLDELATELELAGEDTLAGLRRRYGARPNTQFVRDLWATLRDGWLTRDGDARAWVATELRAAGLGDPSLPDDVRYLQSCRNAETLRRTVLIAFHDLGEESAPGPGRPIAPETAEQAGMARRPSSAFDLDAAMDTAWISFADRLRTAVDNLGEHDSLIIGLPTALDPGELQGAAPYVQILTAASQLRGEVSGNTYLDSRLHLSEARVHALLGVGWTAPDPAPGDEFSVGSANFTVELPRATSARLAVPRTCAAGWNARWPSTSRSRCCATRTGTSRSARAAPWCSSGSPPMPRWSNCSPPCCSAPPGTRWRWSGSTGPTAPSGSPSSPGSAAG
jgi:hypothetical protein